MKEYWKRSFSTSARQQKESRIAQWTASGFEHYQGYFDAYLLPHLLKLPAQAWVLDAGCGPGTFARRAASLGCRVAALDFSETMIHTARRRCAGEPIFFSAGEVGALPYDSRQFSLVFCLGVLQYLEGGRALEELARVIRPGGTLILMTLNRFSAGRLITRERRPLRYYNPFRLRGRLRRHFERVRLKGAWVAPARLGSAGRFLLRSGGWRLLNAFFPLSCPLAHSFYLEGIRTAEKPLAGASGSPQNGRS